MGFDSSPFADSATSATGAIGEFGLGYFEEVGPALKLGIDDQCSAGADRTEELREGLEFDPDMFI